LSALAVLVAALGHNLFGLTSQKLQILALTRFLHANQHPFCSKTL
jgi:hypothetical protein